MEQLPGASDQLNNLWFYLADEDKTCELMNELVLSLQLDENELARMYTPIVDNIPLVAKKVEGTAEIADITKK